MAILCSCRNIGDKTVNLYFRNHQGEMVRLQEVMAACQTNKNPCCSHVKECVEMLDERIEGHNLQVLDAPPANPKP